MAELTEQQSNDPSSTEPQPQTELQPVVQHTESQQTVQQPVTPQPTRHQPKPWRWPSWKGFSDKTGWDWLQLLIQILAVLAIPIAIALGTTWFSFQQNQTSLQIANAQQQEATLQSYLDRMSDLLLTNKLGQSGSGFSEVKQVARVQTLAALRRLDAKHKVAVLQFLYEANLITRGNAIVTLNSADLRFVDLHSVHLYGASLGGTDLRNADLRTDLGAADLSGADLRGAYLTSANLTSADLRFAHLNGVNLSSAGLNRADLSSADLSEADLSYARLTEADLSYANLSGVNLRGAYLGAADLSHADLTRADLGGAVLDYADLRGTKVSNEQLAQAKSLKGATMPDGSKHP